MFPVLDYLTTGKPQDNEKSISKLLWYIVQNKFAYDRPTNVNYSFSLDYQTKKWPLREKIKLA